MIDQNDSIEQVQVDSALPRAISKEKDGITLYWLDDMQEGGLHIRGIASLLNCEPKSISDQTTALEAVGQIDILEAEVLTDGGLQTVKLVLGQDLAKLLRQIARSNAKQETKDLADDVRDRLVAAGFKLAVMLELAPEKLVEQVETSDYVKTLAKEVEIYKNTSGLLLQHLYEVVAKAEVEKAVAIERAAGEKRLAAAVREIYADVSEPKPGKSFAFYGQIDAELQRVMPELIEKAVQYRNSTNDKKYMDIFTTSDVVDQMQWFPYCEILQFLGTKPHRVVEQAIEGHGYYLKNRRLNGIMTKCWGKFIIIADEPPHGLRVSK